MPVDTLVLSAGEDVGVLTVWLLPGCWGVPEGFVIVDAGGVVTTGVGVGEGAGVSASGSVSSFGG